MVLPYQVVCHPTEDVSFTAHSDLVDAAVAWVKERSRAQ